jgi:hypothetical protein
MKYWEVIADNLKKAGWNLGWCQPLIVRGKQSELLMPTPMKNVSLCTLMKG